MFSRPSKLLGPSRASRPGKLGETAERLHDAKGVLTVRAKIFPLHWCHLVVDGGRDLRRRQRPLTNKAKLYLRLR